MHRQRYTKNPEFNGLGEIVWKYLHNEGGTIEEIHGSIDVNANKINSDFINRPVWHSKSRLDRFVEKELNLDLRDYGDDKSRNPLYKAVANEIRHLRRNKLIVDLRRTEKRRAGVGTWRLADSTQAAKIIASRDMKNEDFGSHGHMGSIYVREKQNEFRNILLRQYGRCLFCGFDLDMWMIGAHIVPFHTMRKEDPYNSMNPTNGLLLCKMFDVAFEHGHIMVERDYRITITDYLLKQPRPAIKSWLDNIMPEMCIGEDAVYKPSTKYLEWKKEIVRTRIY